MDRWARSSITLLLAIIASLVVAVAPAWAHHKDGHDNGGGHSSSERDGDGDADSDSDTAYTEDNDTNDGNTPNNVPDEGDNQHPSGKDRSVENGGSGTQGKSESNPDDTNGPRRCEGQCGSPDKPNGMGGEDLADQDGNNGCGNDDDFDDDNNGWCGKPKDQIQSTTDERTCEEIMGSKAACDDDVPGSDEKTCVEIMGSKEACDEDDDVLGGVIKREANPKGDDVLGVRFGAGAAPAAPAVAGETVAAPGEVLPFTGAGLVPFAAFGLALLGAGTALVTRTRR